MSLRERTSIERRCLLGFPDCCLIGSIPQRLRLRSFQSWNDSGARKCFLLLLHFSIPVCRSPPLRGPRSEKHSSLKSCQEGRACRGDSTQQCHSTEMQIPWRRAIPSWGRKMCVSLSRTKERGRQVSAGWMQKGFSVADPWQAVRQSSLANYNISRISTVCMTLKSISEPQSWFRFSVPIIFLLLLLIICLNWFILTN